MNITFIKAAIPLYVQAFFTTLKLGAAGVVLSLILGFLGAVVLFFKLPVLTPILKGYGELARNTPLLIQLFFLYYGLPKVGLTLSKSVVAIMGLTFLGTAYMMESFLSAFDSVPNVQIESGRALGFSKRQLTEEVIFPQALRLSVNSVGANVIFLMKETSVFSGIAIMDLTNLTRNLIGMYYRTNEYLLLLVIGYCFLIIPIIIVLNLVEKKVRNVRV